MTDSVPPLGVSARAIIDSADGCDAPAAADKERMRARLASSIGAAIVGATATTAAVKGTTATAMAKGVGGGLAGTTLIAKLLAAVVVAGAVSVGYVAGRRGEHDATRAAPTAITAAPAAGAPADHDPAVSSAAPLDPGATAPADVPARPAPPAVVGRRSQVAPAASASAVAAPPAVSTSPSPLSSTEGEAALLQRARAAIDAGDGVTALDALDMHERKFPGGILADQRQAERVIAMCTIAKVPVTRERAEHFLAERPRSQQAARIRRACGLP